MLTTNLKIARRNLIKNRLYTIINLVGLTTSFTACILIALFVKDEISFDKHFADSERLYRIAGRYFQGGASAVSSASSSYTLLPLIDGKISGVEKMTRIEFRWETITVNSRDKYVESEVIYADSTFFDVFSVPFLAGDRNTALADPTNVVLEKSIALKYFGTEEAMGRFIELNGKQFKVAGVMKAIPANSHFNARIIIPMHGVQQWFPDWVFKDFSGTSMYTYLKASNNFDVSAAEQMINNSIALQWEGFQKPTLFLQPVTSIHLQSKLDKGEIQANGSKLTVYIFSATAVVVLFLACINYINLSMGGVLRRIKEVGMRRLLGSTTRMQIGQFQTESLIIVTISAGLAFVCSKLAMPWFNYVSGKFLDFSMLGATDIIIALMITGIVIATAAGSFPALALLKLQTISMLSGKLSVKRKSYFRSFLITFQFSISIALIASTLIVMDQINFMSRKDLGIDPEQLVIIPFGEVADKYKVLKEEMMRNHNIIGVTASSNKVTWAVGGWRSYKAGGAKENVTIPTVAIADNFFDVMGAKFASGRTFSKDFPADVAKSFVINEAAAKFLNLDKPVGSELSGLQFNMKDWNEKHAEIIGVVKDFHLASLHTAVSPIVFDLASERTERYSWMEVRIARENSRETLASMEAVWKRIAPDLPFQFEFMEESLQENYVAEERFRNIFVSFSILAVMLGVLGLFGLTALMSQRRTKEIGIRKVIGASVAELVGHLSMDFLKLVLVANAIGWPIAIFFIDKWLQNFAYRVSISPWIFLITGLAAIAIAFGAIIFHSLKVSIANPVNALRCE